MAQPRSQRIGRGFRQAGSLLEKRVRTAGESRGFSVAKVLTHWDEIVGPNTAQVSRPVNVSYGRKGIGATLTILTTGAYGPILQAQLPRIREKVNACYGYNAIARIRITQTSPTGFGLPQPTAGAQKPRALRTVSSDAVEATCEVQDEGLRAALASLGSQILKHEKN